MSKLYSMQSSSLLIGCLLNQPKLLLNNRFSLEGDDFEPCIFHRILFWCIRRLLQTGVESIDEIVLDTFLQGQEEYLEICNDNNFLEVVPNLKLISDPNAIEYYYSTTRKFTTLRYFKDNGYDIKEFFDESKEWDKEMGKLDKVEIEDIVNYYKAINAVADKRFNPSIDLKEIQAGETFLNVKESFKTTPYFGACLQSPYQTTLYRGWCKGHLLLRSAPSGFGKTILAVGDLCSVCATEYYDSKQGKFISNPNCEYEGGLFINSEMELDTELQPMFIAWIADIPRSKIMDGVFTLEEEKRLDYANQVLLDSKIYLVDDPKFSLFSIENTIKEYTINKNVGYIVIDYFQDNGVVGKEMAKTHTVVARDTIILNLAEECKRMAREYSVAIMSMTQLNGNEKLNDIIDEASLSGGKAVKNKIDAGCIIMFPRKKEIEQTKVLLEKRGFNHLEPNAVIHNYKIRFGKYGTNIKLFQYIDLGTGRVKDLCATNVLNKPINIEIVRKE